MVNFEKIYGWLLTQYYLLVCTIYRWLVNYISLEHYYIILFNCIVVVTESISRLDAMISTYVGAYIFLSLF